MVRKIASTRTPALGETSGWRRARLARKLVKAAAVASEAKHRVLAAVLIERATNVLAEIRGAID